jgi:hypothetical protein
MEGQNEQVFHPQHQPKMCCMIAPRYVRAVEIINNSSGKAVVTTTFGSGNTVQNEVPSGKEVHI